MINIYNTVWDAISETDISCFLNSYSEENIYFEFKSDDVKNDKLAKEISAFANTYGGYVFLGIGDDKSINGCEKWNEQRIHTVIYDSISPAPAVDVKSFVIDGKTIYIIKIEEGLIPPYITNNGSVFIRLSSGSFPIKDSTSLSLLYNKRADHESYVKNKIEIEGLYDYSNYINNLCGYIDLGFSITCSEYPTFQKNFLSLDIDKITKEIFGNNKYSISRVGDTFEITFGEMTPGGNQQLLFFPPGMHNYMVLHSDCSVSFRIMLLSGENTNYVDILGTYIITDVFKKLYEQLCGKNLDRIFVHAQKYERLVVYKQFVPIYDTSKYFPAEQDDPFKNVLISHRNKYGDNLVVQSVRSPSSGYDFIDRRLFDKLAIEYNNSSLINELFRSNFFHLGYIDQIKK